MSFVLFLELEDRLKQLIRNGIAKLQRHDSPDLPIFVFSTRRSGSTWLMQTLAAAPQTRYSDEPLIRWGFRRLKDLRPSSYWWAQFGENRTYTCLSEDDLKKLKSYLDKILSGEIYINPQWEFWKSSWNWSTTRCVININWAPDIISWVSKTYSAPIIYLIRHPIPRALSIIREGWSLLLDDFLNYPRYLDTYLTSSQKEKAFKIAQSGSTLEKFILEWCLNIIPVVKNVPHCATAISYEKLVVEPMDSFQKLAKIIQLPVEPLMRALHEPSSSTNAKSKDIIRNSNPEQLIRRWRKVIGREEELRLLRITDIVEVPIYKVDYDYPIFSGFFE